MFFQDSLAATGTGENPKAQEEGGRPGGPREQLDWVGAHGGHWWLWYISHVELEFKPKTPGSVSGDFPSNAADFVTIRTLPLVAAAS